MTDVYALHIKMAKVRSDNITRGLYMRQFQTDVEVGSSLLYSNEVENRCLS